MERDPVCGMEVHPQTASHLEYLGRLYYFCSTECRERFIQNPEQYMDRVEGTPTPP